MTNLTVAINQSPIFKVTERINNHTGNEYTSFEELNSFIKPVLDITISKIRDTNAYDNNTQTDEIVEYFTEDGHAHIEPLYTGYDNVADEDQPIFNWFYHDNRMIVVEEV